MRADLPAGTVTFLFTDVEGSTLLLHELGPEPYAALLHEHRRVLRESCRRHAGAEVDTQGDALFFAFASAAAAVAAAQDSQVELAGGPVSVRMGLHTGSPHLTEEGYVGEDVHLGARVASSGHGGQVLLSAATRSAAGDVGVTDLGEHRLKDFDRPVAIFQLGTRRFPPLRTISNTNLPRPASSFLGREREVADVVELVGGGSRIVTLTGPGGTGKTRLAIEAASELVGEFKAGVVWLGLATLRDPALVIETIAQTLGAKDDLAARVGERELLLLLDNFEQVVEAAPELSSLVRACPNLSVLVTSRELLRIDGEVEYPVPTLAEPEAVELFSARSRLEPDETVAELCRRLDDLPLAVELAAARTSVLSPAQILERLGQRLDLLKGGRDADPRQQTLRATIEWSLDLLDDDEKRLFARLAVFLGGCALEAAEDVVDADLDTLQSLVEKSLVRRMDDRFWMLETIRELAEERLRSSEDADALEARHAAWFVAFVDRADGHLRGDGQLEWLAALDEEFPNIRAAYASFVRAGDGASAQRLASSSEWFMLRRGRAHEVADWLSRALELEGSASHLSVQALTRLAHAARIACDFETSRVAAERAVESARELGDEALIARALEEAAGAAAHAGEYSNALDLFRQAFRIHELLGDEDSQARVVLNLGWVAALDGRWEDAATYDQTAVAACRRLGNRHGEAKGLVNGAEALLRLGSVDEGFGDAVAAAVLFQDLDDRSELARCLEVFALAAGLRGDGILGWRLVGAAQAERERLAMVSLALEDPGLQDLIETSLRAICTPAEIEQARDDGAKVAVEDALVEAQKRFET